MSTTTSKRVAQVFLEAKQAEQVLARLRVEAAKWIAELEKAPKGSKAAADAAKNLSQISTQYNRLERSIRGSNMELAKSEGVFASLKKTLGPVSGMIAGAFGVSAIIGWGRASLNAFRESEQAVARAQTAYTNAGSKIGLTFEQLTEDANRLQDNSLFTDEQILNEATTRFLNFGNIAGENLLRAQQAAVDLSTAMEGDLSAASMAVGKALSSPVEGLAALQRQGIRFSEDQKGVIKALVETGQTAEAQNIILAELEKRYAGQAAAQAEAEGGLHKLNVAMDNLSEGVGGALFAALNSVAGGLGDVIAAASDWLGLTSRQSEAVIEQQVEMNALFGTLRSGMLTEKERAELVQRINTEYKDYLPTLLDVNGTEREYANVQAAANRFIAERITLLAKQELLAERTADAVEERKEAIQAEIDYQRILQGGATALEKITAAASGFGTALQFAAVQRAKQREDSEAAQADLEREQSALGSLSSAQQAVADQKKKLLTVGDMERASVEELNAAINQGLIDQEAMLATNPAKAAAMGQHIQQLGEELAQRDALTSATDTQARTVGELEEAIKKLREQLDGTSSADEYKKIMDQITALEKRRDGITAGGQANKKAAEDLKRLSDTVKKASDEMLRARLTGMEREVAAERDKYAALREQAHGNAALIARITELEGQGVLAIRAKYAEQEAEAARKLAQTIRELRAEQIARDGGTEQLALQAIRRDYAQRIEAARTNSALIAGIEGELAQAIEAKTRQATDRRVTANELALQAIRDGYAQQLAEAEGNAQERLRIEQRLEADIAAARAQHSAEGADARLEQELEALRQSYAQRIQVARTGTSTLAAVQGEMDAAIAQHIAEREARQLIANERELQTIRASYDARFKAAEGNAQQTLALEDELAKAITEARTRQQTQPDNGQPTTDNGELQAIRASYAERIAAAQETNTTILQLQDRLEAALTAKQVEQFAAKRAAEQQELQAITDSYAERLALAREQAEQLAEAARQPATDNGQPAADGNAQRVAAAQQAAEALKGIETELNNALAIKRQEQVEGTITTQVAITDATVQGYADRLGATAIGDRAEIDAIISKYDELFLAAQNDSAKRAELEVILGIALRDKRTEQFAERQQQMDEWNAKVQDERVAQAEAALAFMDEQHEAEITKAEEQNLSTEEMRARHQEERRVLEQILHEAKVDDINQKYEELYALADAQGFDTTELHRIHGNAIAQLEKQQAADSVRTTEEKNKRIVDSEKRRNAALKQVGMDMLDAFAAIWTATAGNAEEAALFNKVITGFKIAIDTASAISSIIAGAAVGDPYTAAVRIAAGVTLVLTNIAKATELLKKDPPSAPAFSGAAFAAGGPTQIGPQGSSPARMQKRTDQQAGATGQRTRVPAAQDITWYDEAAGTTVTLGTVPKYKSDIAAGGPVKTSSYGLIGEKGPEYVVDNTSLNRPDVAPYIDYLDKIRTTKPPLYSVAPPEMGMPERFPVHNAPTAMMDHVSGMRQGQAFAMGGPTRGTALVNATAPTRGVGQDLRTSAAPGTTATTDPALLFLLAEGNRINAELSRQIEAGIGVNWDKFEDAQDRINTIRSTNSFSA